MKRLVLLSCIIFSLFLWSSALAIPVELTIESYAPATFGTASTIIDIPDINDQVEISRQAALFALSPEGWNLENLGDGGYLVYRNQPDWSDEFYYDCVFVTPPVSQELKDLFGYDLNTEALTYGPQYYLYFHTDNWVERYSHDIGETVNNYGVIGGGSGGFWAQSIVQDWGRFYVEEVQTQVPEPSILLCFGIGLMGLALFRRNSR